MYKIVHMKHIYILCKYENYGIILYYVIILCFYTLKSKTYFIQYEWILIIVFIVFTQ